jgi:hypothetical protein
MKLKAKLGSGYNLKLKGSKDLVGIDVDSVWAVPINFDVYIDSLLSNRIKCPIDSNGNIELSITNSQNQDWMLLLVNSQAEQTNQIVSYITINDPDGTLLKMPLSYATNDIDLGSLNSNSGNEAVSTTNLSDMKSFSLSVGNLREIARTDKLLKLAKNFYDNYDTNDGSFRLFLPMYHFARTNFSNEITTTGVLNNSFHSFNLTYLCNDLNEITYDCTNTGDTITLEMPGYRDIWQGYYGQYTNVNLLNSKIGDGTFYYGSATMWGIPVSDFYTGSFKGDIPSGNWVVKKNGSELGRFDLAFSSILYGGNIERPRVYIPKLKLNVSGGLITGMEVSWYTMDSNSSLSDADMQMFWNSLNKNARPYISVRNVYDGELVSSVSNITDLSDDNGNNVNTLNFTQTLYFNSNFTTNGLADPSNTVNMIKIFYNSYGASFEFNWLECGGFY